MAEGFLFSADDHADSDEAFDAYRRLYANGADVRRSEGPFRASVRAWRYDKLLLFDRRLSGAIHAREERVGADGFDHFTLTYLVEGGLHVQADGQPTLLAPGGAVLLDMRRRMRSEALDARFITVSIMRALVEAAAGSAVRLHGRVLQEPAMGLLGDYLLALAARGGALSQASHPAIARALVDLLSIALERSSSQAVPGRRELAQREGAESFIAGELSRSDLDAEQVAKAIGVSRASLYRLFSATGGVARHIDLRRLDQIRRRLEAQDSATIDDMALQAGFASAREARRAFQRLEGVDPDVYRGRPTAGSDDVERARRRWAAWMSEL